MTVAIAGALVALDCCVGGWLLGGFFGLLAGAVLAMPASLLIGWTMGEAQS